MSVIGAKSLSAFGIDFSGDKNFLRALREDYVEVPVQWSERKWESGAASIVVESPLRLLAGDPEKEHQSVLPAPFIAILIGPSGVGKTEMVRQLYRYSSLDREEALEVLPVSLVQNTWRDGTMRFPDRTPPLDLFRDFLFSSDTATEARHSKEQTILIGRQGRDPQFVSSLLGEYVSKILHGIHEGRILLALDGLDEIISSRTQHDIFFERLFTLLRWTDKGKSSKARIVLSCRLEYLRSLKIKGATDILGQSGTGARPFPVHFLRLDFFGPSRIISYLSRRGRLDLKKYLDEDAPEGRGLGDIMQRPLFLKLLCDIGDTAGSPPMRTTTDILDRLVQKSAENAPGQWTWNNDQLATAALALYKQRRDTFVREEILKFVVPRESAETRLQLGDAFIAIHKCPFLRREEATVRFTHQVFFEYFVARGIWLGLQNSTPDRLSDFDRYVLTVEMRRFLRNRFSESEWRARTLRTYALEPDRLNSWPDPVWARDQYQELEEVRCILLESMTENSHLDKRLEEGFQRFLRFDRHLLHPRYLAYNYESIAAYLWEHRWSEFDRKLESDLGDRLRKDIENAFRQLSRPSASRDDWERLVLRILDIGYRLRLPHVLHFATRPTLSAPGNRFGFALIENQDTRAELDKILKDIKALDLKALRRQAR